MITVCGTASPTADGRQWRPVSAMSPDRLDRDIRGIAKRGLSSAKFRRECGARIVAGLGADAYCFAEIDPDSLHATTYATGGLDRSGASLLHLNEYGQLDFLKLAELVGAPSAAGSLL